MGVMRCSRIGCNSIMCDTHVDLIGYVCGECQGEFKNYLISNNIKAKTSRQINIELKKFMKTEKSEFINDDETSVDEFFKDYTKSW